jgi:hypothetical protein
VEDTACVQFSRQSSTSYGCSRPKTSRRVTKPGSFSEIWFRDLQLLEKRKWYIKSAGQWSESLKWTVDCMLWWYILRGGYVSARYWKLRQIFRRKINIWEDKLLLYHCLLELGYQKSTYPNNFIRVHQEELRCIIVRQKKSEEESVPGKRCRPYKDKKELEKSGRIGSAWYEVQVSGPWIPWIT